VRPVSGKFEYFAYIADERGKKMKKRNKFLAFTLFFILGTFLFSPAVNAYIDPSAMTYIVQVIVGIVIAGGAAVGFYFKKIKRAITKKGKDDSKDKPQQAAVSFSADDDDDDDFDDSKLTSNELNQMNGKK
jgi:hypothetical protein